jgi:hypothetical protein
MGIVGVFHFNPSRGDLDVFITFVVMFWVVISFSNASIYDLCQSFGDERQKLCHG